MINSGHIAKSADPSPAVIAAADRLGIKGLMSVSANSTIRAYIVRADGTAAEIEVFSGIDARSIVLLVDEQSERAESV